MHAVWARGARAPLRDPRDSAAETATAAQLIPVLLDWGGASGGTLGADVVAEYIFQLCVLLALSSAAAAACFRAEQACCMWTALVPGRLGSVGQGERC